MTESIAHYRDLFETHLAHAEERRTPDGLYDPVRYILGLGGKRMRPILVLLGAELYGADPGDALPAAVAVEYFHNFSLVHDDIMDEAPLRRGRETVHEKWGPNTAILSGDAMLIRAYQQLDTYGPDLFAPLTKLLSRTALEVCEGQQFDMEFEHRDKVELAEYLEMIRLKTAVLVGCALRMGGLVGGAPPGDQDALYQFGILLGMAFQLQDDYLDVFGNPESFGKQPGGDIIANKKTYLYLRALEVVKEADRKELENLYTIRPADPAGKIARVRQLFEKAGVQRDTRAKIEAYTDNAFSQLNELRGDGKAREVLREFGNWLLLRDF